MNNIDILEEKEKTVLKTFKDGYGLTNAERKTILNLIETLIAENKELKERNKRQQENLKIANKKIAAQRGQLMMLNKAYIPKSKVEKEIDKLNKKEKDLQNSISDEEREEHSDASISFDLMDIDIRRETLQSLLGKG